MKEQITVAVSQNSSQISCAAVAHDANGAKNLLGSSVSVVNPSIPLHETVVKLLVAVETQADIMIQEVVCHHDDGFAGDSEKLAEALRAHAVVAIPVFHNARDAAALVSWWADGHR